MNYTQNTVKNKNVTVLTNSNMMHAAILAFLIASVAGSDGITGGITDLSKEEWEKIDEIGDGLEKGLEVYNKENPSFKYRYTVLVWMMFAINVRKSSLSLKSSFGFYFASIAKCFYFEI